MKSELNESFYVFPVHTINFKGFVGFGIKELDSNEFSRYCLNYTTINKTPINKHNSDLITTNLKEFNFTGNLSTRIILYGCYYINKETGFYSSYGMKVLDSTNTTHAHCESNHLTQFAGGWLTVPSGIDFNDVWANASFLQNITIYMTVIVITTIYSILLVWTFYMDKRDKLKKRIKLLVDPDDAYFYEIIFYTASRPHAGTDSNVLLFSLKFKSY